MEYPSPCPSALVPEQLFAVGGVDTSNFNEWLNVNISGFGLGSSLYKYGSNIDNVRNKTEEVIKIFDEVSNNKVIEFKNI